MPIKNPTQILTQAAGFPAKLEEKLPAGAPAISTMLLDTAGKLPVIPDLPMEIPDLPLPPELPDMTPPGDNGGLGKLFVKDVRVTPVQQEKKIVSSPAKGVLPEVQQRRGL